MSAPSPPAATAPESATAALYRAALGPVNTAHYLQLFARFDEAGRASPAWNWAAGLLTLNWLAFRQVWLAALVYVACAEGLALLILGLARRFLHWPPAVEWGVLGAMLALCIAIPGAYGNAWLHAETRRRMTRAVREARTVREACEALEKQASTRQRLWVLVALNALLVGALVGGYVAWTGVPVAATGAPAKVPPEPAASAVSVPVVPAPEPTASAPEAAPAPADRPQEVVVEPPPPEPAPPEVTPVLQEPPPPAPPPAPILAPTPPALSGPAASPSVPRAFAINVGLFADPANAEKAHARLLQEGLPAFTQTVEMPKGVRTRVRVGPFVSRAEAEAAAERIRALGLEAQIYQP
ncbi:MAG: SPOR domain-containing protein [Hydrogenophaga sp.]|uniref:SPOR domain-containing protein n=1 Tax=Hydrogenophaga sp. TaxID=1904254 RepID=UPI003D146401